MSGGELAGYAASCGPKCRLFAPRVVTVFGGVAVGATFAVHRETARTYLCAVEASYGTHVRLGLHASAREKLLELVVEAPNDARLRSYVSLARAGMDYVFFQSLSEKIDGAKGDEKKKLEGLREKLLDYTNDIDRQLEARYKQAQEFVETLLNQEDVAKAARERLERQVPGRGQRRLGRSDQLCRHG